jgi:uncharacterized protein YecE (DUF72 family)
LATKNGGASFILSGFLPRRCCDFTPHDLPLSRSIIVFTGSPRKLFFGPGQSGCHGTFRFVLKAPRRITHTKRLKDAGAEVEDLFSVATALGSSQGAVLFQLPPNFEKDVERLRTFLSLLPADRHVAFEFRHLSWLDEEIFALLRGRNCALCVADTDDGEGCDLINTASWGYLRLRRREYTVADLLHWKERICSQPWDHAYVFFKHEDEATGPKFAAEFLKQAELPG